MPGNYQQISFGGLGGGPINNFGRWEDEAMKHVASFLKRVEAERNETKRQNGVLVTLTGSAAQTYFATLVRVERQQKEALVNNFKEIVNPKGSMASYSRGDEQYNITIDKSNHKYLSSISGSKIIVTNNLKVILSPFVDGARSGVYILVSYTGNTSQYEKLNWIQTGCTDVPLLGDPKNRAYNDSKRGGGFAPFY